MQERISRSEVDNIMRKYNAMMQKCYKEIDEVLSYYRISEQEFNYMCTLFRQNFMKKKIED